MSGWAIPAAVCLGLAAGVLSGVFGVGGGILFVPTLLLLGLGQVEAGVQIATRLDEDLIRRGFGILLLVVALRLAFGMARQGRRYPDVS